MNILSNNDTSGFAPPPSIGVATGITASAAATCAGCAYMLATGPLSMWLGSAAAVLGAAAAGLTIMWQREKGNAAALTAIEAETLHELEAGHTGQQMDHFCALAGIVADLSDGQLHDLDILYSQDWSTRHRRLLTAAGTLAVATHRATDEVADTMRHLNKVCPAGAMAAAAVLVRDRLDPDDFATMVHPWTTAHLPVPPDLGGHLPIWWTMQVQIYRDKHWQPFGATENVPVTTAETAQETAQDLADILEQTRTSDIGTWRLAIWAGKHADTRTMPAGVASPTRELAEAGR